MDRRRFLTAAAAAGTLGSVPGAALAEVLFYKPGLLDKHLDRGDTVLLDFTASWCTTCQAQRRVLESLKAENPAYEENIVFIDVDWDRYGRSRLVRRLRVPSRSTLLAMKGDQEIGRLIARTNRRVIKDLLDQALAASQTG